MHQRSVSSVSTSAVMDIDNLISSSTDSTSRPASPVKASPPPSATAPAPVYCFQPPPPPTSSSPAPASPATAYPYHHQHHPSTGSGGSAAGSPITLPSISADPAVKRSFSGSSATAAPQSASPLESAHYMSPVNPPPTPASAPATSGPVYQWGNGFAAAAAPTQRPEGARAPRAGSGTYQWNPAFFAGTAPELRPRRNSMDMDALPTTSVPAGNPSPTQPPASSHPARAYRRTPGSASSSHLVHPYAPPPNPTTAGPTHHHLGHRRVVSASSVYSTTSSGSTGSAGPASPPAYSPVPSTPALHRAPSPSAGSGSPQHVPPRYTPVMPPRASPPLPAFRAHQVSAPGVGPNRVTHMHPYAPAAGGAQQGYTRAGSPSAPGVYQPPPPPQPPQHLAPAPAPAAAAHHRRSASFTPGSSTSYTPATPAARSMYVQQQQPPPQQPPHLHPPPVPQFDDSESVRRKMQTLSVGDNRPPPQKKSRMPPYYPPGMHPSPLHTPMGPAGIPPGSASSSSPATPLGFGPQGFGVKPKRRRATPSQVRVLNAVFATTAFPSTEMRAKLAAELCMTPRAVQIWFQNRRQGLKSKKGGAKREEEEEGGGAEGADGE
ncbi:hypothetical protein HDU96_009856 [Phlyctochytrium bullatum]|nr:hypothetical protein HDU96_009856 [Phlyctochytrium bullatum]